MQAHLFCSDRLDCSYLAENPKAYAVTCTQPLITDPFEQNITTTLLAYNTTARSNGFALGTQHCDKPVLSTIETYRERLGLGLGLGLARILVFAYRETQKRQVTESVYLPRLASRRVRRRVSPDVPTCSYEPIYY